MASPDSNEGEIVTDALDEARAVVRWRASFEGHPEAQYELGLDGRFVRVNQALRSLCAVDDPVGRELDALLDGPDVERVADDLPRLTDGSTRTYDVRGRGAGDDRRWLLITHVPVIEAGRLTAVLGWVRDVSEQRAAHDLLAISEARYRGLFEWSGTGITVTALDGTYVQANPAFCALVGYSEAELVGRNLREITHPDDRDANRELLGRLVDGRVPSFVLKKRYTTKDGRTVWARLHASVIRGLDDEPLHLVATIEDITTQREAEQRLERSQSLLRIAGQMARVGGWAIDAATQEADWSDEMFNLLEIQTSRVPDLVQSYERYHPEDRPRVIAAVEACLADGTPFDLEARATTYEGKPIVARVMAEARRDTNGDVVEVVGTFQDISELAAAHARNQRIAERLTSTLESMTDALYVLDRDWHLTYLNEHAARLLERDRSELLGRAVWEEFPDAVDHLGPLYRQALAEQRAMTLEEYHYEPLDRWFQIRLYPSEHGLTVYFRDISGDRQARVALAEREARLAEQAALLDKARDAIMVWDLDGTVTYWNERAAGVYGWSANEAMGRQVRELLFEDPDTFEAATEATLADGEWVGEVVQRTQDDVQLTFESRWTLVRSDDGDPRAVMAINTDITERRRLEQQFLRAQRMESLGTLAGGIAHDLNNVLAPVMMSSELLKVDETDERRRELLATIESSTRRGADMIRQVLSFARGVEGLHSELAPADLLNDVGAILRETLPRNIRLEVLAGEDLWPVSGEATQLHQVLINLAVNARDAMPNGGRLRFAADNVEIDAAYAAMAHDAEPGSYVRLTVEDTGDGIPADVVDRMFEPFFTTKPQGQGTGLGLSTSLAIVTSHGGFIRVYTEPGGGTTFKVYLPAVAEQAARVPEALTSRLPIGNGELVLVVDDEAAVREVTRQALEMFGYRVVEASDGEQAIGIYEDRHDAIAVVLTDMMMPVMGGEELIRRLQRIDPHVRVVAASGLTTNGALTRDDLRIARFLNKPYTAHDLIVALRDAIDQAG